jgi:hypothetical protein
VPTPPAYRNNALTRPHDVEVMFVWSVKAKPTAQSPTGYIGVQVKPLNV